MSWVGTTLKESIGSFRRTNETTEATDSDSNLHDVELERSDALNRAASIGEVGGPTRFRHIKNNKYMRRLYMVLAALAVVFVMSSLLRLATKGDDKSDEVNVAASDNGQDIDLSGSSLRESHLLILMNSLSVETEDKASFHDIKSPQRRALYWIANEDPLQLEIPETREDLSYPAFLQRYSLSVLAFALGTDVLAPLGFLTGTHECEWNADYKRPDASVLKQGVICNGDLNQVQELVLQTLGLSGSLPREIGHLHTVKHVHLDSNKLAGTLPQTFHQLSRLREFTATRNLFSGHLPTFLGRMADLRHVELSKNKFSGHLGAFGAVAEGEAVDTVVSPLRVLAVDNNELSGPITYLKSLYVLEELYLDNNGLTGHVLDTFTGFTQLAIFTAAGNKLAGKVPDSLLELPSLTVLDLHGNSYSDSFPHGNATSLKYLDLHANNITGALPGSIGSKPNLMYLDVSRNMLTGLLPIELGQLARLQYLFLSDNPKLKPAPIPEFLWQLPILESLAMRNTARTGTLPDSLGELDQLRLLDLERNDLNGTLPEAMENMTSLAYVFLNRNKFSGEIPESFGNLTNIVLINLDHNELTGIVPDSVCELDFEVFTADCGIPNESVEPTIECPCCTKCCLAEAPACNTRDWSGQYGEDWGKDFYERYNIVEDDDVFELIGRSTTGDN